MPSGLSQYGGADQSDDRDSGYDRGNFQVVDGVTPNPLLPLKLDRSCRGCSARSAPSGADHWPIRPVSQRSLRSRVGRSRHWPGSRSAPGNRTRSSPRAGVRRRLHLFHLLFGARLLNRRRRSGWPHRRCWPWSALGRPSGASTVPTTGFTWHARLSSRSHSFATEHPRIQRSCSSRDDLSVLIPA